MCGIAGIVGRNAAADSIAVEKMLQALKHRGPDGNGLFVSKKKQCVFGHQRLAIMDLSDAAAQPMTTPDSRYTLSYNGECYNLNELRKDLPPLASTGDAAVLLHALAKSGQALLPHINGMFAFALWDEVEQRLLLARDRFGQKPLYYTVKDGQLYFASELRALLRSGKVNTKLNPSAIDDYLTYGAVQGPQTIIEEVYLLPASSYLTWSPDQAIKIQTYWTPPREKAVLSAAEIRDQFNEAVNRHLISDAPLGLFLSGGIDSSAILGAACHNELERDIHAVTVSVPGIPQSDEIQFARAMIRKTSRVEHSVVEVSATDCQEAVHSFLNAIDQPSIDGLNTWIVSQGAKAIGLKSVLSGLGSDELFGGYETFYSIPKWLALRQKIGALGKVASYVTRLGPTYSRKLGKLQDLLSSPASALSVYSVRRQLFSNSQKQLTFSNQLKGSDDLQSATHLLQELGSGRELPDQIGLWELFGYMSQTLLRDADVMGMAHSLEIRMPFLDTQFSQSILSLPSDTRTPTDTPKHKLVEAIADYLPPQHLNQKKRGFTIPLKSLLGKELQSFSQAALSSLKARDEFFNPEAIDTLWNQFQKSPDQIGEYRTWCLIVLGHYLKKL